ncbi:MAG: ABC transporter ATP-binding protein [Halobacteriota archaeon]
MSSQQDTQADVVTNAEIGTSAGSIHLENLGMEFDTKEGHERVFSDINFDIEPGTFVTLLGKSGSGKSTMLNIISGVLEPTEGWVRFETEDGSEATLGHVFQSPRLLPWNTCIRNIEYVHGSNPDYTDELAKQYLDLVGLEDQYNKYPTQLSGGQQQRVGIARALSIDPDILLMDEPFSALDEITADNLREELVNIWQQLRKTVLFVTHDMTEAIQLSDRMLMLGDGRIYADIENPLDRPRRLDSEEFLRFRQRAIDTFHSIEDEGA